MGSTLGRAYRRTTLRIRVNNVMPKNFGNEEGNWDSRSRKNKAIRENRLHWGFGQSARVRANRK